MEEKKYKKGWKLSTQFAFFTSALICIIVVFMAGYSIFFVKNLANLSAIQTKNNDSSIYSLIFQLFAKNPHESNLVEYQNITKNLTTNRIIAYLIVIDNKTNLITWTSLNPKTIGMSYDAKISPYKREVIKEMSKEAQSVYEIVNANPSYKVVVGFFSEPLFKTNLDILISHMNILVVVFLLMGLFSAGIMSTLVIRPLDRLAQGAQRFAKGELGYRLPYTPYSEINELVFAYNNMAHELEDLYTSLEQKVKERTLELESANNALKDTQTMMVHSEKMRSLGELVAGITHEINNPVNFIYGNLSHLNNYSNDLIGAIEQMEGFKSLLSEEDQKRFDQIKADIDFNFIKTDLPDLIRSCKEGTERTKNIILDLKNFSRLGELAINDVDLVHEIDTTLNILRNKYKDRITVHKDYQEDVPFVEGFGGQLNQVFMNILDNAAYAIDKTGDVYIRLKRSGENVIVEFEDTGVGIDKTHLLRVFDPFYTTKPVGQGTGLGMSISYKVVKAHNGDIAIESEVGKGTKFTITLPIKHKKEE